MPVGPNREKRPADVVANAVHMMRVATCVVTARHSMGYAVQAPSIRSRGIQWRSSFWSS